MKNWKYRWSGLRKPGRLIAATILLPLAACQGTAGDAASANPTAEGGSGVGAPPSMPKGVAGNSGAGGGNLGFGDSVRKLHAVAEA